MYYKNHRQTAPKAAHNFLSFNPNSTQHWINLDYRDRQCRFAPGLETTEAFTLGATLMAMSWLIPNLRILRAIKWNNNFGFLCPRPDANRLATTYISDQSK